MRKMAVAVLVAALAVPIFAQAQGFVLGVGAGMLLGSNGSSVAPGYSGTVVYTYPHMGRVTTPLEVRFAASNEGHFGNPPGSSTRGSWKGYTIYQLFAHAVPDHANYTVLEALRVIDAAHSYKATFWFAYIETKKLAPTKP